MRFDHTSIIVYLVRLRLGIHYLLPAYNLCQRMGEDYSCASLLCSICIMIVSLVIIIPFGVIYVSLISLSFCVFLCLACCCTTCLSCIQCFCFDLSNYIITQEELRAYSRPQSRYSHQVARYQVY